MVALPRRFRWQTAPPQLLVRLNDPAREHEYVGAVKPLFTLTLVSAAAALPNLLAEMLHPHGHWSLEIDNSLPQPPSASPGDGSLPLILSSRTQPTLGAGDEPLAVLHRHDQSWLPGRREGALRRVAEAEPGSNSRESCGSIVSDDV